VKRLLFVGMILIGLIAAACSSSPASDSEADSSGGSTGGETVSDGVAAGSGTSVLIDDLRAQRMRSASVALPDGRVLVTGGNQPSFAAGAVKTAEVWTEGPEAWEFTEDMVDERFAHAMVVLKDGRVLAAGGRDIKNTGTNHAEVWDPATGKWTALADMNEAHESFAMVVMDDGRVFVAGGSNRDYAPTAIAEIYDPAANTWTLIGGMSTDRIWHTGTLLSDGRVLIVGGGDPDGPYLKNTEIYDPAQDTWFSAGDLTVGRTQHSATLLKDGRVLVVGGRGKRQTSEIYDPADNSWGDMADMIEPRSEHASILLPDGRVLIAGGTGSRTSIESWDPGTNSWSLVGDLVIGRYRHLAELLTDGRIIVMGGNGAEGILAKSEIFSIGIGAEVEAAVRTGTADAQVATPVAEVEVIEEPTPDPDAVVIDLFEGPLEAPIDSVGGGDANQVPTGQPVRLRIGELVVSPSLSTGLGAEFIEVVSDTRCATGVPCDDPGQVEIIVLMRQLDFEFGTANLILRGDQTLPSVKKIGKFSVALIAVDPALAGDSSDPIATLAIVEWSRPR
jgi:hypothetical protein